VSSVFSQPSDLNHAVLVCLASGQELLHNPDWTAEMLEAWLEQRAQLLHSAKGALTCQARDQLREIGEKLEKRGELMLQQLQDTLAHVTQAQRSLTQYQFPCIEASFPSCEHNA
jgi:hypothetical protein